MTIDVDEQEKAPANIISFRYSQAGAQGKARIEDEQGEAKEKSIAEEQTEVEVEEEVKSINSESSFESSSKAFSNLNSEEINELVAKAANMAVRDKYKVKINKTIKKYHSDFESFFKIDCIAAAKDYIDNLPKEKYMVLEHPLVKDARGQNPVVFDRINPILQNPSNNAIIDHIINLSMQLKIGSIRAVYTGERTQEATYGDDGGRTGKWRFECIEKPALASYLVQVLYELPKAGISIPLMSLKFANQATEHRYTINGKSIFEHANSVRAKNSRINNTPLDTFLKDYWDSSALVENSIVIKPISPDILSKIIEETAKCALASTTIESKNFRKKLSENKRKSFAAKLDKIEENYNLILHYAILAGVAQESITQIQNPFVREQFYNDIINLSLAEHAPDGSESLVQKCKRMLDDLGEKLNKLLYPESDLEATSDEEIEQINKLPRPLL